MSQATIQVNRQSATKFKIVTPKATIALKAQDERDRDEWIAAIKQLIGREDFIMDIEDSMVGGSTQNLKNPLRNTV